MKLRIKLYLLWLLSSTACACVAQDSPPPPPDYVAPKRVKTYSVLLSPKAATVQVSAPMARVVPPLVVVSNTCSIAYGLAGQCNGTNVYYWTVTAKTGNGFFQIESSTNLVNWVPEFGSRNMCKTPTNSWISLTGYYLAGTEKRRYFRNRQ